MKKTIGYTALIITTLLLGVVIGFLVNGRFTQKRIEKMRTSFNDEGFKRGFEKKVKPTPEQMEVLEPILKRFGKQQRKLFADYKLEKEKLQVELRTEIDPYLTEEQKQSLERMKKKRSKYYKNKKKPS